MSFIFDKLDGENQTPDDVPPTPGCDNENDSSEQLPSTSSSSPSTSSSSLARTEEAEDTEAGGEDDCIKSRGNAFC